VTSDSAAALEAHSLREQIAKLTPAAASPLKSSLEASAAQLSALIDGAKSPAGKETTPGLDDISGESAALYGQVGQSDAAPTAAQLRAAAHAAEESEEALRAWNKWRASSLPSLNQELHAAGLEPLNPAREPESMPQSDDED